MFSEIDDDEIILKLSAFANSLGKELFVVGGAVRDALFGVLRSDGKKDYDLTSSLSLQEVQEFCEAENLEYFVKNKTLEVVKIQGGNQTVYEHARMRREEYSNTSSHNPSKIEFVDAVEEDVKRRDFTVNSVYYARHSRELKDPSFGIKHIHEKLLQPVTPETLNVDPARILRMVELMARFDLKPDVLTLEQAKKNAKNIFSLSKKRLEKELERIRNSKKYGENEEKYFQKVGEILSALKLCNLL